MTTAIAPTTHTEPFMIQIDTAAREARVQALSDDIGELAAHIHAATARLLELIREFDEVNGWCR